MFHLHKNEYLWWCIDCVYSPVRRTSPSKSNAQNQNCPCAGSTVPSSCAVRTANPLSCRKIKDTNRITAVGQSHEQELERKLTYCVCVHHRWFLVHSHPHRCPPWRRRLGTFFRSFHLSVQRVRARRWRKIGKPLPSLFSVIIRAKSHSCWLYDVRRGLLR